MIGHENFQAHNVRAFPDQESEQLNSALRESQEPIQVAGIAGQQFSALHLNRQQTEAPSIVFCGQWFASVQTNDVRYAAFQQAIKNPGHQVLYVDMVSHGDSDKSSSDQRREAALHKGLSLLAKSQAEAIANYLEQPEEAIIGGISAGGRLAPEIALRLGEMGLRPSGLLGIEIAGVDKRSSLGCAVAYLLDGHFGQTKYHQGRANLVLDAALNRFERLQEELGEPGKDFSLAELYKKDPWLLIFLMGRSPLASDGGFVAIEQAMEQSPNMQAAFVSAGLSRVSRWRKIAPGVNRLLARYPDRLSWQVWPNDNHAMGIGAQQPRIAAFTSSFISKLANEQ